MTLDDETRAKLVALNIRKAVAEQQGATLIAAECTDEMNVIFDRLLAEQPGLVRDHVGECE